MAEPVSDQQDADGREAQPREDHQHRAGPSHRPCALEQLPGLHPTFRQDGLRDHPADDQANIGWARAVIADLQPFGADGSYLNFAGFGEERDALVQKSYQGNYARLQAIKAHYDPHNLFQHNLNIRPAA